MNTCTVPLCAVITCVVSTLLEKEGNIFYDENIMYVSTKIIIYIIKNVFFKAGLGLVFVTPLYSSTSVFFLLFTSSWIYLTTPSDRDQFSAFEFKETFERPVRFLGSRSFRIAPRRLREAFIALASLPKA